MVAIEMTAILEWLSSFDSHELVNNQMVMDHFDFNHTGAVDVFTRGLSWQQLLKRMHVLTKPEMNATLVKAIDVANQKHDYDRLIYLSKRGDGLKHANPAHLYHQNGHPLTYAMLLSDLHWFMTDNHLDNQILDVTPDAQDFEATIAQDFAHQIDRQLKAGSYHDD